MSLQVLKEELEKSAEEEASRIRKEAESEASLIIEAAHKEARVIREQAEVEASELARAEERKLSSAHLRAKHILATARLEVIQRALATLGRTLGVLANSTQTKEREEHKRIFTLLAKDALSQVAGDRVISCREKDAPLARQFGTVSKKFLETSGGLIVTSEDGKVRVDNTFESVLEEKSDLLSEVCHGVLFRNAHAAATHAFQKPEGQVTPKRKQSTKTSPRVKKKKRPMKTRKVQQKKKKRK